MRQTLFICCMAMMAVLFTACSGDDALPSDSGKIVLEFDARVGSQNLQLGSDTYQNALGQDFKVEILRYYISNIKLLRADGTYHEDPLSEDGSKGYYLIDESDPATTFITLAEVPFGEYTGAEFTIGVDANRVSQGAQTGALDPANKLFWSWNSGYIFVQIEGTSSFSTETGNAIFYHVGGYKSDPALPNLVNNIKVKTTSFGGESATVNASSEPEIHMIVDVKKFFEGHTEVDFSLNAQCHAPSCGASIAENYEHTFEFDHLHQ